MKTILILKFFWKSVCYLYDTIRLVTLWKREDLHIPTRFSQIQRTLLLVAKVHNNLRITKDYHVLFVPYHSMEQD